MKKGKFQVRMKRGKGCSFKANYFDFSLAELFRDEERGIRSKSSREHNKYLTRGVMKQ